MEGWVNPQLGWVGSGYWTQDLLHDSLLLYQLSYPGWICVLCSSSLIVGIFPLKKSAKSLAISSCDLSSGSGFICLLLVMLLITENSWLVSLPQSDIFLFIVCCLWYTISQLYLFLSLVYAIQWWGCLYFLHALCLDLTVFCWPLMYLLNHSCLGLSECLIVFSGAFFSSALCSSVLSLWHVWSKESLVSRVGGVKLVSKALAVILVLSLIVFFILGYLS